MVESEKNRRKNKQKGPEFSCFSYRNLKKKDRVKCSLVKCSLVTLKLGEDHPSPTKEVLSSCCEFRHKGNPVIVFIPRLQRLPKGTGHLQMMFKNEKKKRSSYIPWKSRLQNDPLNNGSWNNPDLIGYTCWSPTPKRVVFGSSGLDISWLGSWSQLVFQKKRVCQLLRAIQWKNKKWTQKTIPNLLAILCAPFEMVKWPC